MNGIEAATPISNRRARKSKGFTLIEILLVLAIGAGILFAVFLAVNKVQSKALTKEAAESLNLMVADTRALYRSAGTFDGIDPDVLINNNVPPENMVPNGNQIVSPWNTVVQIQQATLNTADDAVRFVYPDIPSNDCSNFVQSAAGSFNQVEVEGTLVKDTTADLNLDVAQLGVQCTAAQFVQIDFIQGR